MGWVRCHITAPSAIRPSAGSAARSPLTVAASASPVVVRSSSAPSVPRSRRRCRAGRPSDPTRPPSPRLLRVLQDGDPLAGLRVQEPQSAEAGCDEVAGAVGQGQVLGLRRHIGRRSAAASMWDRVASAARLWEMCIVNRPIRHLSEIALYWARSGGNISQMARWWGISRQRAWALVHKNLSIYDDSGKPWPVGVKRQPRTKLPCS